MYFFQVSNVQRFLTYYSPQTKLWKGNVFISVCQEFCPQGGGCVPQHALGQTPPWQVHPQQIHPPAGTPG